MARPIKIGLDYFPFDIDFFEDDKIQFISIKFGAVGETVIIKLLCKIYKNGFYIKFGKDEQLLFSKYANVSPELLKEITDELVIRDFFDKDIYEKYNVITSNGIQKRFFSATERRSEKRVNTEYLLYNSARKINVYNNLVNVDNNLVNVDNNYNSAVLNEGFSTQSKVKESKVKESKVKKSKVKESKEIESDIISTNLLKLDSPVPMLKTGTKRKKEIIYFTELLPEKLLKEKSFKETWFNWIEFKNETKHIVTERSAKLIINKLLEYECPVDVLNQSIMNGWQGIFPMKGQNNASNSNSYKTGYNKLESPIGDFNNPGNKKYNIQ